MSKLIELVEKFRNEREESVAKLGKSIIEKIEAIDVFDSNKYSPIYIDEETETLSKDEVYVITIDYSYNIRGSDSIYLEKLKKFINDNQQYYKVFSIEFPETEYLTKLHVKIII